MIGKSIENIKINDSAYFEKTISESDVYLFAGISGDMNPAHINDEYAKKTIFKERIVHGLLSSSLISSVIGMQLPGPGTIYISQDLRFLAPVKINDTIRAKIKVVEIIKEKNRIKLKTIVTNQHGKNVIEGLAWVMPPKKSSNQQNEMNI